MGEIVPLTNHIAENTDHITGKREVAIYTDSQVTLDSLENNYKHTNIIEEIREMLRQLATQNWYIYFGWVKAHAGIEGSEQADKLAKEAAKQDTENVIFKKIPLSTVATELKRNGLTKWQNQ